MYSTVTMKSGSISSTEQLPIRYDLYEPVGHPPEALPIVLFLHGFKGFKDWGAFPDACAELAQAGYVVVAFNFSLNGVGEDETSFDRLDLFARETLTQDLQDVESVIAALQKGTIRPDKVEGDPDKIGLIGHSRGGHTAIVAAVEHPAVKTLVTWAAVADYRKSFTEQMIRDFEGHGYTEIMNSRTGQQMRIDRVVYDDMQEHADRLVALSRVKELRIPSYFIHGSDDESVPSRHCLDLYEACASREKEYKLIPDTGHTFGTRHPFEDEDFPPPFDTVLEKTRGWFEMNLR